MRRSRSALVAAALIAFGPRLAPAQSVGAGFNLERQGNYAGAADAYRLTVASDPTNLSALLGLERVLPQIGRQGELLGLAQRAARMDSTNVDLRALLLRTYVALGEGDSADALVKRWAAASPTSEAPYREWAIALEDQSDLIGARRVLLLGRTKVGRPGVLAIELAELDERSADWEDAAREWALAVAADRRQSAAAASVLDRAPLEQRGAVIKVLTAEGAPAAARRVGATLLLGWHRPDQAWTAFAGTLDAPPVSETAYALREFADRAGAEPTRQGQRVRGLALDRFAALVPPELAVRARMDAAQAFLNARDVAEARPALAKVAGDSTAPAGIRIEAREAVARLEIESGALDSAAAMIAALGEAAGAGVREELSRALARALVNAGALDRAEASLAGDSSVDAMATRGWIALYRGDLVTARRLFRDAGPYAGSREEVTDRVSTIALLYQVSDAKSARLGAGLLALARGDSAAALDTLLRAAAEVDSAGRPVVRLLAGQVAAALGGGRDSLAGALFASVVRSGGNSVAPAAELAWARLLVRQGDAAGAVTHLEHLVLTYPDSALVPEARRELDRAKGAIPKS